jgi:hypothetical protein
MLLLVIRKQVALSVLFHQILQSTHAHPIFFGWGEREGKEEEEEIDGAHTKNMYIVF